jgi:hypothetical protein
MTIGFNPGPARVRTVSAFDRLTNLAAWAVSALLVANLVYYSAVLFTDIPHIDDWFFTARMADFLEGRAGLGYLLVPENNHIAVTAHLLFLAAHGFAGHDLGLLRWLSTGVLVLTAWVFARAAMRDAAAEGEGARALPPGLVALPIAAAAISLVHWELLSVAMGVTSLVATLLVGVAILVFDRWMRTGRAADLATALAVGVAATLSFTSGGMVWLCLAAQLWLGGAERRWRLILTPIFLLVLVGFLLIVAQAAAARGAIPSAIHPYLLVRAVITVAGTPIAPHINGSAVFYVTAGMGLILLAFGGVAALWALLDRASLRVTAKYLAYLLFGAVNLGLVAQGRQLLPPLELTSSRYAATAMPLLIGTAAVLAVLASRHFRASSGRSLLPFVLLVGCLAPPVFLANAGEQMMAPHRAHAFAAVRAQLTDPAFTPETEWVKRTLYTGDQYAGAMMEAHEFLKRRRLGYFGE